MLRSARPEVVEQGHAGGAVRQLAPAIVLPAQLAHRVFENLSELIRDAEPLFVVC